VHEVQESAQGLRIVTIVIEASLREALPRSVQAPLGFWLDRAHCYLFKWEGLRSQASFDVGQHQDPSQHCSNPGAHIGDYFFLSPARVAADDCAGLAALGLIR